MTDPLHPASPAAAPAAMAAGRDRFEPSGQVQPRFQNALSARIASHFQMPIAQHLLGTTEEHAPSRHKRPREASSISEISGRAIADLGAPAPSVPIANQAAPATEPTAAETRRASAREHPGNTDRHPARETSATPTQRGSPAPGNSTPAPSQPTSAAANPALAQPAAQGPVHNRFIPQQAQPAVATKLAAAPQNLPTFRDPGAANTGARNDQSAGPRALPIQHRHLTLESAAKAPAPRPASGPDQAEDEARFAAQLSRGLASVLRQGGGSLTMRLQPHALGEVTIKMELQPGTVNASFTAATDQARDLLHDSLTHLRSALEARGLTVERLDVHRAEAAEPHQPKHGRPDNERGEPQHHAGGAGEQGRDAHGRRESPETTASGGAVGSNQSPERDDHPWLQDAPTKLHAALRIWSQHVDAGGAQELRVRLDAVA